MTGLKTLVYDGQRNPNNFQYTIQELTSGESYGFTVKAFNFNGEGEESTIAYFKPCTVPSNLAEPEILETTRSSISFKWTPPEDNGACPIQGYVLYLD